MSPRMLLIAAALLACLGSSRDGRSTRGGGPQQPVNDPAVCRASCQRYFACKGVADRAQEENCTRACSDGEVSGDLAYQISISDCAQAVALAEGTSVPTQGADADPRVGVGGPAEAAPPAPTCGPPAESGDPELRALLVDRSWCAPPSADGSALAERVTFQGTGDAYVGAPAPMTALGPSPAAPAVSACWRLEGTTLSVSRDGAAFTPLAVSILVQGGRGKPSRDASGGLGLSLAGRRYDDCTASP